ncbi:MAG: methyltransferase type 11 [Dehalococcoidia bacterium]|nr:methyltransferase type 11 [Dehalococcoidia bacterium]
MVQPLTLDDGPRLYGDLAWLWPIVSPPADYLEECEEYRRLIAQRSQFPAKSLLHLGSGGGHHDSHLKRRFAVSGVDSSPAMLALAGQLNPDVTYHAGDLRDIRLNVAFDAVAYMLSPGDLRAAFATAFAHLRPGGVFLTVVEMSAEQFQQNQTWTSASIAGDTEVVLIENAYDPDRSDTTYEATFLYLIRRFGRLTIEADRHTCGIFPLQTWLDLLADVGFVQMRQNELAPPGTADETSTVLTALRGG